MPQARSAPDATESVLGLDGEETLSDRASVGERQGPTTQNGRGKEDPSSSSSAGSKRKRNSLSSSRVELNGPEAARTSSGDSTWSEDSFDNRHQRSLSRNKDGHIEHSVNSGGVAVIRQPRGVLRLRKLAQNVSIKSGTGGSKVLRSNGIAKATQVQRRNKRRKSRTLKENRVGGNDPVGCMKIENGTCDLDNSTKFCSENDLSSEKQSRLSGEPSKHVHAIKESSVHVKEDDDVSLEENAARMLCSLSDNRCASTLRKNAKSLDRSSKAYFIQRSDHFKDSCNKAKNVADPARLPRNRDGKVSFRKRRPRRHFYEVRPHDVDPYCIVKERIRVFWPLDETWYFGLVKEYDPVTRLHHVRYDDKDEEWINLQNERIKLLLLPSEARQASNRHNSRSLFKPKYEVGEREDMDGNSAGSSESGPIMSMLARSNQARSATSSNMSKRNHTHSDIAPILFDKGQYMLCSNDAIPGSSPANGGAEVFEDRNPLVDRRFRFVYSRNRSCRRKNGFLNFSEKDSDPKSTELTATLSGTENVTLMRHAILVLSQPLKSVYKIMHEACYVWLLNTLFLLQHGAMVALWPAVHLDILLVDNTLGLKHLLLETCLRSAVSFFCLLVGSFNPYSMQNTRKESNMPCTSVRVQISGLHGRRQVVFVMFSFVGIKYPKWKHLQGRLQHHCMKRGLHKVNCRCANIRQLTNGTDQRVSTSVELLPKGLSLDARDSQFFAQSKYSDVDPVIFFERSESAQNHLDVASAPSLLFFHHLKLLGESNSTSNGFPVDQQSLSQHTFDLVHLAASASEACSVHVSPSTAGPLDTGTVGCINHSSSASRELNNAERTVSLEYNGNSTGDANITRSSPDQNVDGDKLCSSNLTAICPPQKSQERCSSIIIPQDKMSDPPDDELLNKDEKVMPPTSNLVQELNEYPIGRATPTAPRTTYHRNRFTSISRAFGDGSKLWQEDIMITGFAGGSKKPRTQVSYSVSPRSDELGLKHKGHFRKIQSQSIAKTSDAKRLPDNSRSEQSSPESLTCVANVLVTVGDRGWREYDTQITIDSDGQSERRICVKLAEGTKYAHKVSQVLQPGATNRYTHAMIWKGGTEWCLEFPDRSQWLIFKQMHDECYSHNIRAASVKNIPIPGVRFAEAHDDHDAVSFVRSQDYISHIGTDVEMALDESHVIYDMDSDDEGWVSRWRKVGKDSISGELTDDLFEGIMDKFEKLAYSHNCNELTIDQMKELESENNPLDTIKVIHDYWQEKRKKKGMPLIRHFQSAMWKVYEQQLQEWESTVYRLQGSSNGYQEKKLPPKPALFAFCLRPRGLQVQIPHKGPKQRSHKKLMSSGCHSFSREQDSFYRPAGRKYSEYVGDGRTCESYDGGSIYSPTGYSPRFSVRTESPRSFDGSERSSTPRFFRTNSVKRNASFAFSEDHQPSPSFRHQRIKRSAPDHWNTVVNEWQNSNHLFPGASQSPHIDIEELKRRDASSAALHAVAMAKFKREKAHLLMHKADLALHKATLALMIADAIKASSRDSSRDGRRDLRGDDR